MWPWQRIYSHLATIALAIKGSSAYLATVQTIVVADRRRSSQHPTSIAVGANAASSNSCYFFVIQNHNSIVTMYKGRLFRISTATSADSAISRSTHTINMVRSVH